MASQPDRLHLVDGSSYLFRAFHALPPLTSSSGEPTGAMFGVLNMLRKLLTDHKPKLCAVIFDASGKTFRNDLYQDYKANRPPMPADLRVQLEPLLEMIEAMGFPLLRVPGVEADDVIGTLATQAAGEGRGCLISTSDKDMAQLVDGNVELENTMSDTHLDVAGVKNKFGVEPEKIVDYLALIGDKIDNVPGVDKVGPKTAAKWLDQHGDLDGVIANADSIKGKIGDNLRDALDHLPLSRELVTIKRDVELDVAPADLELREPDTKSLRQAFERFEFRKWLDELEDDGSVAEPEAVAAQYDIVTTQKQLASWMTMLEEASVVALDTETTSLDPMEAELVGISFAIEAGRGAYIPLRHEYEDVPDQLDRDAVLQALSPILNDEHKIVVGQHFKYDLIVLARYDLACAAYAFDTMLESYVLNSTAVRHNMDAMANYYLNRKTIKYEDVAGKGAKQKSFAEVEIDQAGEYAAEDADVTLQLHQALWPRLEKEDRLRSVFQDLEMPLVPVLAAMERRGVLVDADRLAEHSAEMGERLVDLEAKAHELAGREFNLGSPKQLQEILFEEMELPVRRKTPKGAPSTAEDVLQDLARDYELPQLIMDHRSLSKLRSTYTDKLPAQINAATGRVHTSYHQAVAATGRLSSSDPNLQNIPIRTAEGRRIREAFVAPDGWSLVAADYSQIELRIMAHLSGDESLLDAFAQGQDIHAATAAEVFGGDAATIDPDKRRAAKAINFGLIYGMSAFGLARQLDVPRGEAQEYIDVYFERYPGVKQYMDSTRDLAKAQGYVETVFGRRLYLNDIAARNPARRQGAERAAINAPMQGTAADIIKRAMLDVHAWLAEQFDDRAAMTMQVHDELVFEVRDDAIEDLAAGLKERMAGAASLDVPLLVEVGSGKNWNDAH